MSDENQKQRARELKEARENDRQKKARRTLKKYSTGKNKGVAQKNIKDAKNLIRSATPTNFFSLFFQIKPTADWMYGLALMAAIFKDLLDLFSLTGILYFVILVITFCVSIFIAFMMLLGSFSSGHGRKDQKIIRSWLVLLGGTTMEMIFGISLVPIETATVLIVYMLMLAERKQFEEEQKKQSEEESLSGEYWPEESYA